MTHYRSNVRDLEFNLFEVLGAGERFGLIRFGSRLDVYLPEGTKSLVSEGQTAVAGETVLADFRLGDGGRTYRAD